MENTVKEVLNIEEVFPEVNLIENEVYRQQVIAIWQECWQRSEWTDIYAVSVSPAIDYCHVVHNRAVIEMALAVAETYEKFHKVKVDKDVLITAGLLQDVSKLIELNPDSEGKTEFSDLGKTYPHAFWGAQIALQHGVTDEICEIIINHTPDSPRFPKTIEGKILYYVDQLDVIAVYKDRWKKELKVYK